MSNNTFHYATLVFWRTAISSVVFLFLTAIVEAQTLSKTITHDEKDTVCMRTSIYFSRDGYNWIEKSEFKKAGKFVQWALSDTLSQIRLIGWTDSSGSEAYNRQLSLCRARTVRNYLIRKGVSANRIQLEGHGIDTKAINARKARRTDMIGLIAIPMAVNTIQPEPVTPTVEEQKETSVEPAMPETVIVDPIPSEPENTNPIYRWYVGIEGGILTGISTFTSFTPNGKAGFEIGVLGGYSFSPFLSAEAGITWGKLRVGTSQCCSDYWLGDDGIRYLTHVAGIDSYSYKDIYSSVSMQKYTLRVNMDMLQIVNPNWNKRWSLTISPTIQGIHSIATLKQTYNKDKIIKRDGQFQFGAGVGIGGGYQITSNLGVGLRSSMTWIIGKRFDGIMPTDHKENLMWSNVATLTWRFDCNK